MSSKSEFLKTVIIGIATVGLGISMYEHEKYLRETAPKLSLKDIDKLQKLTSKTHDIFCDAEISRTLLKDFPTFLRESSRISGYAYFNGDYCKISFENCGCGKVSMSTDPM